MIPTPRPDDASLVAAPALAAPRGGDDAGAPNWAEIPFTVDCPRCSAALNGHTEPYCPACSLALDWQRVLPLDELACPSCTYQLRGLQQPRCPECGATFEWSKVLDEQRRRDKPLFEYQYRRRPIRMFLSAVRQSLRPGRPWRSIQIYDPPDTRGQAVMALMMFVWLVLAIPVVGILTRVASGLFAWLDGWNLQRYGPVDWWLILNPDGVLDSDFWLLRHKIVLLVTPLSFAHLLGLALIAVAGTLATLLLLRQSMRQCRVRKGHITRALLYALIPALCACTVSLLAQGVLSVRHLGRYQIGNTIRGLLTDLSDVAPLVGLAMMTWSLTKAYRIYIWMPHAFGVAITALAVGTLTSLVTYVVFWME